MARDDDAADGGNDITTSSSSTQSAGHVSLERTRERERLARMLEHAPFAVAFTLGPSHVLISANALQRRLFGPGAKLNLPLRVAFPAEELEPVHASFDRAFRGRQAVVMREQRMAWDPAHDAAGERGYFDLIHQPIMDEQGNVEGLLCVAMDVSESVHARETVSRAHAELERRIAERTAELAASNEALAAEIVARNDLQRRLALAREDEQRRTARDLHDQVGQTLSALMLAIKAACELQAIPAAAISRLEDALRLAEVLGRDVHEIATRLRPAVLDAFGLHAALRQLLAEWSARCAVSVDFEAEWLRERRFPAEIETALFRVVQEALTNVARHAQATHVSVVVEHDRGQLIAVVEDDGTGFSVDSVEPGRSGLVGMRERVTLVGGTLDFESEPAGGTTVIVTIPITGSPP